MDAFFRTHTYLVEHVNAPVRRRLMDEINWDDRLIGIKGTRGVGKTTFLLQYAKERYASTDRQCLYINMNNFYFQGRGIADFAGEFCRLGGKVLLIDQVFKQPDWSRELRLCYDNYPGLKIVFTGSSVMRLKEENPELNGIVKSYNLRGFSFREFLNLQTDLKFEPYTLKDILNNHEEITRQILSKVSPMKYFKDYIHHGFYPFFLEHRNFSENLLKTMNMMTEVDILLIKQIDLKYLTKIKKLFYLLALEGPKAPNISNLAKEINTSRATVMNYIKNLADARLINLVYPVGQEFPKKPAKVILQNSNLIYAIYPIQLDQQQVMETFFVNAIQEVCSVNEGNKQGIYIINQKEKFKVCDTGKTKKRFSSDTTYTIYNTEVGKENQVPLWLMGFLY
ncbi:ATP-binding protein [Prevotella fusca]|uniref:AAA family ATPase n=1 Tax=Prevotella fusca JCM 17724 TaxID=1236517 RepID=A0A0K1NII4_9BACT|nr:AAA family ATPase [Prevotella fusca]AKU68912.1 AAA family ATPase [Prevotella fusca JCM 17724]QUB86533.1 ATP-binding protein [Prevotella fusca JCM 17724]